MDTMLGATSSNRGSSSVKISNCPRTRLPTKPSTSPNCAPVTREPTSRVNAPALPRRSVSGWLIRRKLSMLDRIHSGRSTTWTSLARYASRPVVSWTSGVASPAR